MNGTEEHHMYHTLGTDSEPLAHHPRHKKISTPKQSLGLHLIMPSFDGHIYVIDGVTHCAQKIDVGEHMYSMPLIDDITGDGFLDLLVGTMNGQVLLMETSIPYHPLNAWSSFPKGRLNGFTHGMIGISIPSLEKIKLGNADIVNPEKPDMLSVSFVNILFRNYYIYYIYVYI